MKRTIFLLAFLLPALAFAQYKRTAGYAQVSGGALFTWPKFGSSFTVPGKQWTGAIVRNKYVELGFVKGHYSLVNEPDSIGDGNMFILNFHCPVLSKYALGYRPLGLKGFLIQPFLSGGYAKTSFGNEHRGSVNFAPGISVQLPYVLFDARLMGQYYFGRGNLTGMYGFHITPMLSAQLDGLLELYHPEMVQGGTGLVPHYENEWHHLETDVDNSGNSVDVGYYSNDITGMETYTAYAKNVGAFWSVMPFVNYSRAHLYKEGRAMPGIAFGGRWGFYGFDAMVSAGKAGFGSTFAHPPTDSLAFSEKKYSSDDAFDVKDARFKGKQTMLVPEIRGEVDVFRLALSLLFPRGYGVKNMLSATRFFRFYMGCGIGYAVPIGSAHFSDPTAAQGLDNYITTNHLQDNSYADARKFSSGMVITPFTSLELGALGFSWQRDVYYKSGLANGNSFTVSYILPIRRLAKAYRGEELQ